MPNEKWKRKEKMGEIKKKKYKNINEWEMIEIKKEGYGMKWKEWKNERMNSYNE